MRYLIPIIFLMSCSTDGYETSQYSEETKCCTCTEKLESKFNRVKDPITRVYLECMDRWQDKKKLLYYQAARICKVHLK